MSLLKKDKSSNTAVHVPLGNGLMNDAWFGQTVDPSQTGQTSLKYFGAFRENKNALDKRRSPVEKFLDH